MKTLRRGFTLLELLAAVVLAALLATATSLSIAGATRVSRVEDAIEQMRALDRMTRAMARGTGKPLQLLIDIDAQRIKSVERDTQNAVGRELHFGDGIKIEEFCRSGKTLPAGTMGIPVSNRGLSATYAIRLASEGRSTWVLVLGLTGQMIELSDEPQVKQILSALAQRDDAR